MFVRIYEVVQSGEGKESLAIVVSSIKEKDQQSRKKLAKSISSENPATRIPRFLGSHAISRASN